MHLPETLNMDFISAQYDSWRRDPRSVTQDWRWFFQGFELAGTTAVETAASAPAAAKVRDLIDAYRRLGHLLACMDPLSACPTHHPLLALDAFGLAEADLDRPFAAEAFSPRGTATLRQIVDGLKQTYCRSIGVEYMHLQDPLERRWLEARMEPVKNAPTFDAAHQLAILKQLTEAAVFERFLNKKFQGVTRFSLEGGDALLPLIHSVLSEAADRGCKEVALGMAHRGRLNVQAHVLQKPYERIFEEFENCYDPGQLTGAGDVKYHNGYLAQIETEDHHRLQLFLASNPSHLEAVNPVVEGVARARQARAADGARQVLPLLIHGDAAFSGQGIVAETLNMSQLKGYRTGGTVHVVINNQIGYTTLPEDARSTRYSTDVAKMLMVPILHVHGENPEAVVHAARIAAAYRYRFGKDVVIDLVCYRRYGHNEGDEPYFTQPLMYARIKNRPSPHTLYAQSLVEHGRVSPKQAADLENICEQALEKAYNTVHGSACDFPTPRYFESWSSIAGTPVDVTPQTAVDRKRLLDIADRLHRLPEGFAVHPKLQRLLQKRHDAVQSGGGIDWANAEALAFASLLAEKTPVRLSGQDVARGTFSQRHSTLTDIKTGKACTPLNHLYPDQAAFMVYNSPLAEAGVLGFEYGYSCADPHTLVIWEAQFGDFINNAQSIVDLFIASGEAKWKRFSGLTLLLPHGYEGLGPEHSSARPERFLQLCADKNLQVCNPTTPAQYFHVLRRQMKAAGRKPLILLTPKSLLRHPLAVSPLDDFHNGTFRPVLDDPDGERRTRRVVFCSGKIFYQLLQQRRDKDAEAPAIVRLEQMYPFPRQTLQTVLATYPQAEAFAWVQEEPANMGAWSFVRPRLEALLKKGLTYIGRRPAASPATGFPAVYRQEQQQVAADAIGGTWPSFSQV